MKFDKLTTHSANYWRSSTLINTLRLYKLILQQDKNKMCSDLISFVWVTIAISHPLPLYIRLIDCPAATAFPPYWFSSAYYFSSWLDIPRAKSHLQTVIIDILTTQTQSPCQRFSLSLSLSRATTGRGKFISRWPWTFSWKFIEFFFHDFRMASNCRKCGNGFARCSKYSTWRALLCKLCKWLRISIKRYFFFFIRNAWMTD